jgi:hypothetical protein
LTEFHRTNINIRKSDYKYLLDRYGHGWTTEVREMITRAVDEMKSVDTFNFKYPNDRNIDYHTPPKLKPEDLA